ncbi:MAG: ABC transporter substrate-binding protein [Solirubrobacterales bacterium]
MDFVTKWKRLLFTLAASLVLATGIAACGGDDSSDDSSSGTETATTDATLVLDFIPGAVHAGIYEAVQAGYYTDNGINLRIIEPTSTADTLKLIDAGKADFGVADGIDLASQINDGREAQGIMALLQRPPGGLITLEETGIETPADLAGQTIGVTGVPSDNAILDTILENSGTNPDDTEVVTIGFNGVQALESEKVAAFTGFIPADGVQVEADGFPTKSFPLDENGGPSYPGLVVFSTESMIAEDPDLMQGFVDATVKGYQDALADPAEAIDALISETQGIDKDLATQSFDAWVPLMGASDTFGEFNNKNLEELSQFLVDSDLISEPIAPDRFATTEFSGSEE